MKSKFTKRHRLSFILIIVVMWVMFTIAGCNQNSSEIRKFAGKYEGTYSGASSGSWTATFSEEGVVEALISDTQIGGEITGRGRISANGELDLETTGSVMNRFSTITWKGSFKIVDDSCVGNGTWGSASEYEGKWEGKRI